MLAADDVEDAKGVTVMELDIFNEVKEREVGKRSLQAVAHTTLR